MNNKLYTKVIGYSAETPAGLSSPCPLNSEKLDRVSLAIVDERGYIKLHGDITVLYRADPESTGKLADTIENALLAAYEQGRSDLQRAFQKLLDVE